MHISVSDAKAQLTELVRLAEEGEEIVLTRHGRPVARLTPTAEKLVELRVRAVEQAQALARKTKTDGPSAARSQDFLFEDDGLP